MKVIAAVEMLAMFRVRILLLAVGIFCILFPTTFCDFIPLIVGVSMMIVGVFGIFVGFETRNYKTPEISGLGDAVVLTLLGFVIVISQNASLLLLGVIWGLLGLGKGAKEINTFLYRASRKENFIFPLVIGILEVIFGLILILEPTEHIAFHVIILGINMVLFSIKDPAPHKKELHQIVKEVL
ncbi:MAG TPA: DUF308 domain-containing protein [Methanocorpusculum sp.]|nr:DUF308 domain-containing protein [Methanocorpusculum sp.]